MACLCTFKTGAVKHGILTGLASDALVASLPLVDVLECLERNDWRVLVSHRELRELYFNRACADAGASV